LFDQLNRLAPIFSIYRSSAGSGKTRTLAKEYLKLALQHKAEYFKYILAVTFTNKASQEMKDRILFYLDEFASGRSNELAIDLQQELNLDPLAFQQRSQEVQSAILHQYGQFSISTIDAFFQKVIRSFTRETGLIGDYKLEVEQDAVLEQVIDNLIDELGSNAELTSWVVEFAKENLENEKAWDVRYNLMEFSREIFREEFKAIEEDVRETTSRAGFFKNLQQHLWQVKRSFLSAVSKPAKEILASIETNGWTTDDFYYGKGSGLFTFLKMFAYEKNVGELKAPMESRVRNNFVHAQRWPSKTTRHAATICQVAEQKLVPDLLQILDTFDREHRRALTAEVALKNLYVFGLIADIARKLKEYKDENNLMLLADAPKFLQGVIQDSDTPFIYEKVGSFYRNYLIDEFQDTSGMQWKNFQPLITNSLDQGQRCLVVGDVKQAIYRWRGGDLKLLQQHVLDDIGKNRSVVNELARNFRSAANIVSFNNELFKRASELVGEYTGATIPTDAYADVKQDTFKHDEGIIRIEFLAETEEEKSLFTNPDDGEDRGKWKKRALDSIPALLEELQLNGIALKDIAIIVRKNDEGQRIAAHLLQYKNSEAAKPGCRYDVVSNESLRIDGAATVNLLLGAMYYLLNPENAIARAQLGYEYARLHEPGRPLSEVFNVSSQVFLESNLPPAFTREKGFLKKLGLIELTETLVEIFDLGSVKGELIYLQAFQDLVLEFYSRERNDLGAFLEWWEDNKHKKSIQISGDVDAAQIITIHKSKGLQFKYVVVPFCSWGMDHDNWQAPNLWVKSEESPFNEAGFIPVKYASTLANTCFDSYYSEERTKTFLDNLNLLYVAFTRAESGLFITAPAITVKGSKDSVAALLYQSIVNSESLIKNFDDARCVWTTGNFSIDHEAKKKSIQPIILEKYIANRWQKKIVIKRSAEGMFDDEASQSVKINYGLLIHSVLSRITFEQDVAQAIDQLQIEGTLSPSDKEKIQFSIGALLALPQVKSWFVQNGWTVRTEVPIIMPDGNEARIDRLLTKDKDAVVIDFKTGAVNKKDEQQVRDYMEILRLMNFVKLEGFLLYLKDNTVVEVKSGSRQKVVKKIPSKDQLSLGF
jgi:ATP-dependent helicase/nuclease subunit A